jgi:hypothetical protein
LKGVFVVMGCPAKNPLMGKENVHLLIQKHARNCSKVAPTREQVGAETEDTVEIFTP